MRKSALVMSTLLLAALLFSLAGCKGVVGNGDVVTREVTLKRAVTGVKNAGSFDIVIDPSLTGKAVIEGESNILDLMEADQDATGVFRVAMKPDIAVISSKGVTVRLPKVEGGAFEIAGSGGISLAGNTPLKGDTFELKIAGSGDIDLAIEAQQLKCDILGSGNVTVKGTAKSGDVEIAGSGNYNAADCKTEGTVVRILGSGNAQVNASDELECNIYGSGNVLYRGNPPKLKINSNGSGQVNTF